MINALPFEWFVLLLRILFIFLLYFFLFQVVRVITRELQTLAAGRQTEHDDDLSGHLIVKEAGLSGLRRGAQLELDPVTVIGRHPRSTIQIDDTYVSSEHAQIAWSDGYWWVTDLGSTNGTTVNGEPVSAPIILNYGDVIEIGPAALQLAP